MENVTKTLAEAPSRPQKDQLEESCRPQKQQRPHQFWPLLEEELNDLQDFIAADGEEIQVVAGVVRRLRKMLETASGLALRRVAIKQSRSNTHELCSVCGEKMILPSGSALFQADSWDIVCSDCGHLLAPELHCLVSRSQIPF